ncbi:kinase-like domain-containing protein [Xylariales sp. PMI_506]|nr:kinase-like domain-containing protein [Xylariales sp. PMI_506]
MHHPTAPARDWAQHSAELNPVKASCPWSSAVSESSGVGPLGARFDIGSPRTVEFPGGPSISIRESDGTTRQVHDGDYCGRRRTASDTSSVISVNDLGFMAALSARSKTSPPVYDRAYSGSGCDDLSGPVMSVEELRHHLNAKPGVKAEQMVMGEQQTATAEHIVYQATWNSLECSALGSEEYLPIDAFERIFDIETIKTLVKEKYADIDDARLYEKIRAILGSELGHSRRRILATLVIMKSVDCIDQFIDAQIWDYNLPLERLPKIQYRVRESSPNITNDTFLHAWDAPKIDNFLTQQHKVFIPFFDIGADKLCSYNLDSKIRLPWEEYERKTNGGNGIVHRIRINPHHHNFASSQLSDYSKRQYFALKEINSIDRETYRQELWALEKTTAQIQKEKHLIKLLLTFQHGEKYYLLFEWADGNLEDFWETSPSGPLISHDTKWQVNQYLGIANAVKRIHGLSTIQKKQRASSPDPGSGDDREWGRHGDIKPSNILWFESYGQERNHLVLSDLGLTRYHSSHTRSNVRQSKVDGWTGSYRPPEMDLGSVPISQRYDIWSLGCVFLEFCTWCLKGLDGVHRFGHERWKNDQSLICNIREDNYFIIQEVNGRNYAIVKPEVETWIKDLQNLETCTPFSRRILSLISEAMLVVEPHRRWKIDMICRELNEIKKELSTDAEAKTPHLKSHAQKYGPSLHVREHEITSSAIEPALEGLVQHAEGNYDSAKVDRIHGHSRTRSLSIRSGNSEPADSSPVQNPTREQNNLSDSPPMDAPLGAEAQAYEIHAPGDLGIIQSDGCEAESQVYVYDDESSATNTPHDSQNDDSQVFRTQSSASTAPPFGSLENSLHDSVSLGKNSPQSSPEGTPNRQRDTIRRGDKRPGASPSPSANKQPADGPHTVLCYRQDTIDTTKSSTVVSSIIFASVEVPRGLPGGFPTRDTAEEQALGMNLRNKMSSWWRKVLRRNQ